MFCIDIPIGLTDRGPRECDRQAREVLGTRRSSVFPAPIRPAVEASTYADACRIRFDAEAKRVSKQAFMIYPKIREVDRELRANPSLRVRVREVHPEVSFWAWNGRTPMAHSKKTSEGKAARRALIDTHFGNKAFAAVRARHSRAETSDDDIADAFAALWTALRAAAGAAATLPVVVPTDTAGLSMEMCY